VNGSMTAALPNVTGGKLGGTGTVGAVTLDNGTLAPGGNDRNSKYRYPDAEPRDGGVSTQRYNPRR
jgi:hypothetical protein